MRPNIIRACIPGKNKLEGKPQTCTCKSCNGNDASPVPNKCGPESSDCNGEQEATHGQCYAWAGNVQTDGNGPFSTCICGEDSDRFDEWGHQYWLEKPTEGIAMCNHGTLGQGVCTLCPDETIKTFQECDWESAATVRG